MSFFLNIWNKIKKPRGIYLILFYIFFVALIVGTLTLVILQPNQTIFHYILYPISAIALTYFVYTIVYFAPRIKSGIMKFLKKYKFTNRMLESYGYRTIVFSVISFILNLMYVVFIGVIAIITRSVWYISISVYYFILIFMKLNIFSSKKKYTDVIDQAKIYRYCGIMFIFLTIALSGIVTLIYMSNMYFEYAGLLIYVVATFTFYKLTLSIINIFKARKQDDMYIKSIRNINLASSCVSILVLQVAMFQAFAPEYNTSVANGLTGAGVSAIILFLGVLMIIKANKTSKSSNLKNISK